jgi:hypothetical protein
MFYCGVLYHGTDKKSAKSIIAENFKPSEGDNHWLGNGIYFFEDDVHAYHWILEKYVKNKNILPHKLRKSVFKDNKILCACIEIDKNRIFDLDKLKYYIIYVSSYREVMSEIDDEGKPVPDGAFINLLFDDMGFGEDYDIVKYTFHFPKRQLNNGREMRSANIVPPQTQICVKNYDIIKDVKLHYINNIDKKYNELSILFPHIYPPLSKR